MAPPKRMIRTFVFYYFLVLPFLPPARKIQFSVLHIFCLISRAKRFFFSLFFSSERKSCNFATDS